MIFTGFYLKKQDKTMEQVRTFKNVELVKDNLQTAELPKIRKDFIAKLENALMFLSYKDLSIWHSESKNKVHLNNFDGAWLLDVSLKHKGDDGFAFSPFGNLQVTPDMFPKLNIKMLNLSGEIGHLSKYRFLDSKEKRHLDNYRYIFSEKTAFLDYGKQKWWTDEQGYGFNQMHKLNDDFNLVMPLRTSLKKDYVINQKDAINYDMPNGKPAEWYIHTVKSFHMALQLSLTYDYEWSCYIKETPDSLGVRIPIHPSSSKEVFMMRNLPEGKTRKRAIVNFVKDHYRTIKGNGNERKVLIEKHFRGDLKFNWRGLEVHVTPSPYDLRRYKSNKKFLDFE